MWVRLFALIVCLSCISSAFAQLEKESCSNVDIVQINPKLKNLYSRVRNQSKIGWCYAFTAADMVTAEVDHIVSSIHMATNYNRSIANSKLWRIGYGIQGIFTKTNFKYIFEITHLKFLLLVTVT